MPDRKDVFPGVTHTLRPSRPSSGQALRGSATASHASEAAGGNRSALQTKAPTHMEAPMTLNLTIPAEDEVLKPQITVIGIGGAGGNAVNNMISSGLSGCEFMVANTDAQALQQSSCPRKLQLGRNLTRGLGAGARPDVGRAAAEEAMDEIMAALEGCNMVFITAGMGGGTGTGAAPVVARAAREQGILTVGVITKPFHFEGVHRMRLAEAGINELTENVDTLIIIPNQNLFRIANEKTTFADAFKMADDVLESGVRGVTDLMVLPGLINLDFNDIRTVMTEMGKAMMGTGEAEGEGRAVKAAEAAIANPLLDDVSMRGARGVLINITGSTDLTLFEVDEAANKIREQVDPEANIIFGSTFDHELDGKMRVSIVATGIDAEARQEVRSTPSLSVISNDSSLRRPEPAPAAAAPVAAPPGALAARGAAMAEAQSGGAQARAAAGQKEATAKARGYQQVPATAGANALSPQPVEEDYEAEEEDLDREQLLDWDPEEQAAQEPAPQQAAVQAPIVRRPAPPQEPAPMAPEAGEGETEAEDPAHRVEAVSSEIESKQDSFVAPPPLRAEKPVGLTAREPQSRTSPPKADPFREAELSNASREQADPQAQRKAGGGLISRMTGLFAQHHAADRPEEGEASLPPRPELPTGRSAAQAKGHEGFKGHAAEPKAPQQRQAPAAAPAKQARFDLDQGQRPNRLADEQMLDIPAFLRRQSN